MGTSAGRKTGKARITVLGVKSGCQDWPSALDLGEVLLLGSSAGWSQ
jgi:hypothetical protein